MPTTNKKNHESLSPIEASDTLNIFDQYKFQQAHREFEQSYLDLVTEINNRSSTKIDTKERNTTIYRYTRTQKNYSEILQKIKNYQKNARLRCFSAMKTIIRGILIYDQKFGKKTFRYDPEKLIKEGIFTTPPTCPSSGTYSIIVRDGRRYLHCSIHGTLKQ